jgi:hypothetical protein
MVTAQDDVEGAPVWLGPIEEDVFSKLGVKDGENEPGCKMGEPTERIAMPDGGFEIHGLPFNCEVTYSDARLSGTQTTLLNERCFSTGGCINWGTQQLVGPEGTWNGWFTGTEDPRGNTNLHIVLTGSGAYEGLTSIRHATGRFYKPLTQTGLVYEGDPPPVAAASPTE